MARGSINKVILIGTLGRDPEMRFLPNGNAVASKPYFKQVETSDKENWHKIPLLS